MPEQSQDVKARLLQTDDEYQRLATQHQGLEVRLQELAHQSHLSDLEQVEEATPKKRKVQVRDQMESVVRLHYDDRSPRLRLVALTWHLPYCAAPIVIR